MDESFINEFESKLRDADAGVALAQLADRLKQAERFGELFDVRLMQARLKHGLPAAQSAALESLPEPLRRAVEEDYLAACREIGFAVLERGRLREAWKYLRPAGEQAAVAAALTKMRTDEENGEEMIEVALHEGVAPEFGFKLLLEQYGLCNAISTMESVVPHFPLPVKRAAAAMLVRELHGGLLKTLREEIAEREGKAPQTARLRELLDGREWLFADGRHHVDTSHLSAVVRSARLIEDREALRLALDLTEYGRRLHPHHQYADDSPFTNSYATHRLFFAAQLGEQVDEALDYFRKQTESNLAESENTMPAETFVVLLAQLGRYREALEAATRFLPPGRRVFRFAPSLAELCRAAGDFAPLLNRCKSEDDPVGFARALIEARGAARSG
jgi:tetratricopeptide (TPR) repeat protein